MCRDIFPDGLPEEFSFVSTFRMTGNTRKERWNLFQITDRQGNPQYGVRLDGQTQTVEFYFINYLGQLQAITFNNRLRRVSGFGFCVTKNCVDIEECIHFETRVVTVTLQVVTLCSV
jgi:hypothetical protein